MRGTSIEVAHLWNDVKQNDVVLWSGPGWEHPGVEESLRTHGLRLVDLAPGGVIVQPMPAWQLPRLQPGLVVSRLAPAYDSIRATSELAADRGSRPEVNRLLHRASSLLDELGDGTAAVPAEDPRDCMLPSNLDRLVRRWSALADRFPAVASQAPEGWAEGLVGSVWRHVARDGVVEALGPETAGLVAGLHAATTAQWPGFSYLRTSLSHHPLRADAHYLAELLRRSSSIRELARSPRPELLPETAATPPGPEGEASSDETAAVLWWGIVGPHLLEPTARVGLIETSEVAALDAVARLVAVAHDLHAPATLREVLGLPEWSAP